MAYCPDCGCIYDETEYTGCPNCQNDNYDGQTGIIKKEYERRQREKERKQRKQYAMSYFLGLLRRIAIYGIIGLLICLIFFGANINSVIESAKDPHTFTDFYYCYTVLCFPLLILTELILLIIGLIQRKGIFKALFNGLWTNIYYPFYSIYVFFACIHKKYMPVTAIAEFISAILLIGFNVVGVLNVAEVLHL